MYRLKIIALLFLFLSCQEKRPKQASFRRMPLDSILLLSQNWKQDSTGCLGRRNPKEITRLIQQTELIGKDTTLIIKYLGKPNYVSINKGIKTYAYFLECYGDKKISYSNFYCRFSSDTLWYVNHSIY